MRTHILILIEIDRNDLVMVFVAGSSTISVRDGTYENTGCPKHIVPAHGHNRYTCSQPCQLCDIKVSLRLSMQELNS